MTPPASQIVPPSGPRNAKIVILGEAPGENEASQGKPFVGASGNLLRNTLRKFGINPDDVYFTNVVKVRPPYNNFDVFYTDGPKRTSPSELLLRSYREVHLELQGLSPNVIVPVGVEALNALVGRRPGGISAWRGSILPPIQGRETGKIIPTFHPAYILRQNQDLPIFEHDIGRAVEESKTSLYSVPQPKIHIQPSFSDIMDFLRSRPSRVAFDIETTFQSMVRCLGFAYSPLEAIVIPFMGFKGQGPALSNGLLRLSSTDSTMTSWWSEEEEWAILQELNKFFLDENVEKEGQNGQFDMSVLGAEFGLEVANYSFDTMLGHHTCYCELPKGLDFLASIYTKIPYWSDYDASNDLSTWKYCGFDAVATFQCSNKIREELGSLDKLGFYREQVHLPMLAYTRAQNKGVKIHEEERQRQRAILEGEIKNLETKIRTKVGKSDFNPSSPKQVAEYLYGTLGIPPVLHHKSKNVTVDKNAMEKLSYSHPEHKEFFDDVREHGSKENIISGFFNLPLPMGRVFTSYNVAGTDTGRLNSSKTFIHPLDSTNLQNIQKPGSGSTRRCFVADDGWELIKADLSQAEWRLVLGYGKITRILQKYKENPKFDVHRWVASLIYNKPEDQILTPERDIAKNGVYGGNYMMGDLTAARTYHLPFQTAKFVLASYRKAVFEVPLWWEEVRRQLAQGRVLENVLGFRRMFFGRMDDEMLRAALSHLAQSTVACIINRAAAICDELFPEDECHILLQTHDELVFQARKGFSHKYVPVIRNVMEHPLRFEGLEDPLIIPVDIGVGPNWLDCKKVA